MQNNEGTWNYLILFLLSQNTFPSQEKDKLFIGTWFGTGNSEGEGKRTSIKGALKLF